MAPIINVQPVEDKIVEQLKSIFHQHYNGCQIDQLEKPEELVLFRPSTQGGLGLHSVKYKAMAMLIRSFLETSVNPKYQHNLYHVSLFDFYVLKDDLIPDPGLPPYYSADFFESIRNVHLTSHLEVATMSSSDWYHYLVEDNITMHTPEDSIKQYLPSRTELAWPANDWDNTWRLARLKGLGPEVTTFLWKLPHNLLPTQERISRITRNSPPLCKLCLNQLVEDQPHAFFLCNSNNDVNNALLSCLTPTILNLSSRQILLHDFQLDENDELPVVWMIGNFLHKVWTFGADKKLVRLFSIRADLEARASLLRETRFDKHSEKINAMLQSLMWI